MNVAPTTPTAPTAPTIPGSVAQLAAIISNPDYNWRAGYRAALVEVGLLLIAESDRLEGKGRPTNGAGVTPLAPLL